MSDTIEAPAPETPRAGSNLNFINADGTLAREALLEYLQECDRPLATRRIELLEAFARTPTTVSDAETHKRFLDFSKQIATCLKAIDGEHTAKKAPWLAGGQCVDNRWHELRDALAGAKSAVDARAKKWSDAIAEAERQARIAAQRAAEAEAERVRREAEEAEKLLAQPAATVEDLDRAIATDQTARKAEQEAAVATRDAEAKPAELARTRTELGALGTLQEIWVFRDLDRAFLDLERLREHFPYQCLEQAVRAYIKAGGRECSGVTIERDTKLLVR